MGCGRVGGASTFASFSAPLLRIHPLRGAESLVLGFFRMNTNSIRGRDRVGPLNVELVSDSNGELGER